MYSISGRMLPKGKRRVPISEGDRNAAGFALALTQCWRVEPPALHCPRPPSRKKKDDHIGCFFPGRAFASPTKAPGLGENIVGSPGQERPQLDIIPNDDPLLSTSIFLVLC